MPFTFLKNLLVLVLCFVVVTSKSQYSKVHYLPPTYNQNSSIQFSTITVTTLVEDPFDVSITNASGTYSQILSGLSKSNPITITLPKGDNDGIFLGSEGKTNIVLNSEGFILDASKHFFTSQIHSVSNQAAVIAPKGIAGLGMEFYSGHLYAQAGKTNIRSHFISVIASEDNTTVTFDNPNINWEGQNSTFSVLLNKGESYVVAAPFDYIQALSVADKFNAYNGTHVTADKPIAMNSGSFLASYSTSGLQDAGVDQIVPVDRLNDEFILVQGQATNSLIEIAMIVATEDNTEVFVNGSATSSHILNKGEYVVVTGDNYINGTMHLETSYPAMVYQNLGGSNSYATLGMVFVPGLMEDASRSVLVSGANSIGDLSIYIVAKKGEAVLINGIEIESTPIENLGNSAWVTYRIFPSEINSLYCTSGSNCANKGVDSDFLIESTGPINAAISLVSGVVGAAGYFSGFASVNTDVGVSEFGTLEYNLSCMEDTVSLYAKGAGSYIWESPSGDMNLLSEVNDSIFLFDYDQSGDEGPFTYSVIMETTSLLGFVQKDTVVLTVNVAYTPECEKDFIKEDSLFICLGDSIQINAHGINETKWYGEEPFIVLNDSTIRANPKQTTTYYFNNFIKKQNALINGDFEEPDLGIFSYQIINASTVPGWNTTASDNQIEVWYDGFLGAPAYKGKQFIELNANMPSALYQDIPTNSNTTLMWGFAHRGRNGVDYMDFEVGPPGGPYEKIGTFSDGKEWEFYSGLYEVPEGQTTTRFYYTSAQDGSSGNLLDGIEFFTLEEKTDSIVVVVNSLPQIDLGQDTTVCLNESFTLALSSGESFLWNTLETTSSIAVDSIGEYTVTVKDENQCSSRDTISVDFISCERNFVLQDTLEICEGDTLVVSGVNITTETWWSNEPFNLINDSSIEVFQSIPRAVYYVGSSAIYADSIVVLVHENPEVKLLEDTTICAGEKVVLSANIPGTYTWSSKESSNEIEIDSAGLFSLEVENEFGCKGVDSMELFIQELPVLELGNDTSICEGESVLFDSENEGLEHKWNSGDLTSQIIVSSAGSYKLTVIDSIGCTALDSVRLIVHKLPNLNIGKDTSICEGNSVVLTTENSDITRLWNTLETTNSITVAKSGTYSVEISDNTGCTKSDSIAIAVIKKPIVNLGNDTAVCAGELLELNAGNVGLNFVWNTGEIASTITVLNEGVYVVEVSDDHGCIGVDSFKLLVNEIPFINIGNDTNICEGDSVLLFTNKTALNHLWNTEEKTSSITAFSSGTYSVLVSDSNGCSYSDSLTLLVTNLPIVNLGNDTAVCAGELLELNAGNVGLNFVWNTGEIASIITVLNEGVYVVEVSGDNGCIGVDSFKLLVNEIPFLNIGNDTTICEGQYIHLKADTSANKFLWSTGENTLEIIADISAVFSVEVISDFGCKASDSLNLKVNSLPIINLGNDTILCEGENITLNAFNSKASYTWNNGAVSHSISVLQTGIYNVSVSDDIGCTVADTIEVKFRELPVVNLGMDTTICESETLTFQTSYPDNYTTTWSTGSIEKEITINSQGLVTLKVKNEIGCLSEDDIFISQEILPDPFPERTVSFCEGDEFELEPSAGNERYDIYWLESKFSRTHTVYESGVYSGVIAGNFCIDTALIVVTKIDTPNAIIKDVNSIGYFCFESQSIYLSVLTNEDVSIEWEDFGESNRVEITEPGNYPLTVSNENCISRYSYKVENYCPGKLYLPNSFTPNDDGLNDVFKPVYHGTIDNYELIIYNRWGKVFFFSNDINKGWDGTLENVQQTNDVYVYKISFGYISQYGGLKREQLTGTVTLLK